jgi:hypothetical protein
MTEQKAHKKIVKKNNTFVKEDEEVEHATEWNVADVRLDEEKNIIPAAEPMHDNTHFQDKWVDSTKEKVSLFIHQYDLPEFDEKEHPFDEKLITEIGQEREAKVAVEKHLSKDHMSSTYRKSSVLKIINSNLVNYKDQMNATEERFKKKGD